MPRNNQEFPGHAWSILIVSDSPRFDAVVKKSLKGFITIDARKSCALARRCILERDYDIVVIRSPLSDERGEELALDIAGRSSASVLIVAPQDYFEDVAEMVTDSGIFVIAEASFIAFIDKAIRYLVAIQNRIYRFKYQAARALENAEEIRVVSKAKLYLIEKKGMSEDEAHRIIGKTAMNNGISRRQAAERILEE